MKTHKPKTIAEVSPKKLRERCDFMLTYLLGPENIEKWWSSPNMAFDGKTAKESQSKSLAYYKAMLERTFQEKPPLKWCPQNRMSKSRQLFSIWSIRRCSKTVF